jgi:hypothetical protein
MGINAIFAGVIRQVYRNLLQPSAPPEIVPQTPGGAQFDRSEANRQAGSLLDLSRNRSEQGLRVPKNLS